MRGLYERDRAAPGRRHPIVRDDAAWNATARHDYLDEVRALGRVSRRADNHRYGDRGGIRSRCALLPARRATTLPGHRRTPGPRQATTAALDDPGARPACRHAPHLVDLGAPRTAPADRAAELPLPLACARFSPADEVSLRRGARHRAPRHRNRFRLLDRES